MRKQSVYQIYLPPSSYVPRLTSTFKEFLSINEIHQADLLYLPKDEIFKYALTLVDVATRFKVAVPSRTKTAKEAFENIYNKGPLKESDEHHVDKEREFKSLQFKKIISTKTRHLSLLLRNLTELWQRVFLYIST